MHTWLDTQPEGWWRIALDNLHVPYTYISTQTVAAESDLRSKYDVILFAPVGYGSTERILNGIPMWGNAMPWQKSELTPNLGRIDSTPDMRPGLGETGLAHLRDFISQGGLFIASQDAAEFAIDTGLAPGVSVAPRGDVKVVGTILNTALITKKDATAQSRARWILDGARRLQRGGHVLQRQQSAYRRSTPSRRSQDTATHRTRWS